MKRILSFTVTMLVSFCFYGCMGYPASHKTFANQSTYWVGKSIQNLRRSSGPSLGTKDLVNGHIEEGWVRGYRCREFFEYDPQTNMIIGWRFEGSTTDCISVAP
jgi:hypothetical protein